jgi:hypothetical protein
MTKGDLIEKVLEGNLTNFIFWDDDSFTEGQEQIEIETLNGNITIWPAKDGKHLNVSGEIHIQQDIDFNHD